MFYSKATDEDFKGDDIGDCDNVEITIRMIRKSMSRSKSECPVHTFNLSCKLQVWYVHK